MEFTRRLDVMDEIVRKMRRRSFAAFCAGVGAAAATVAAWYLLSA
jgi:hypothetical protein